MLVLYETTEGIALFKTSDTEDLRKQTKNLKLINYKKYKNFSRSLESNIKLSEGKVPKTILKTIKSGVKKERDEKLAIYDKRIGKSIHKKCKVDCVYGDDVNELMREIRTNFDKYVPNTNEENENFKLSLSHLISTKKIKFSPEKVDLMIVQAIALVDDIDKELNTYLMRIKEWYGWHFPELVGLVVENEKYVKVVEKLGIRKKELPDLSEFIDEETEERIRKAVIISMGTDISADDEKNIKILCKQYIEINEYRQSLQDYLKTRMKAIAPNLCNLVGEIVGARLIAKAGSLLNLAKSPASTIQIFGAEKALFRSLKTKSNPPKYGLIYHAKLISGQTNKKKGKAARILANNAALASRFDALSNPSKIIDANFSKKLKIRIEKALEK